MEKKTTLLLREQYIKLKKMDEVMKLQNQVAEIAEDNKKKVAALQAKFEKVEAEAYDECPVCYGSISVKNTCCMPNCDHKMCKNCYYNWLDKQEKNTCPMCRAEVFKNNLDIIEKKGTLQRTVNSLEDQIVDLYDDRREIRKDILRGMKGYEEIREDVMRLESKYEQLDNEIFDKQQIVDEVREYERHHDIWKKKRKRRLGKLICVGREKWRTNIINVHKELFQKNFSWYEDELAVREEFNCFDDEVDISESNMFDEPCDEVDISESNMFDEPEDLCDDIDDWCLENRIIERDPRSEHKSKLEDSLHRIQKYKLYKSAYNYGWRIPQKEVNEYEEEDGYETDDTDETSSMPELIDATDQELENIVLEETTFSQDELEYDRGALNVPSQLEEGEIIEPPRLTRVNRRLNFNYTDAEDGFSLSINARGGGRREVTALPGGSRVTEVVITEWERAYLNRDEGRSTGEITSRSVRI
tara:strand:- start:4515 stop:5930 length:1416 start_codon:yes stop_codon:yes gene_type:complete